MKHLEKMIRTENAWKPFKGIVYVDIVRFHWFGGSSANDNKIKTAISDVLTNRFSLMESSQTDPSVLLLSMGDPLLVPVKHAYVTLKRPGKSIANGNKRVVTLSKQAEMDLLGNDEAEARAWSIAWRLISLFCSLPADTSSTVPERKGLLNSVSEFVDVAYHHNR